MKLNRKLATVAASGAATASLGLGLGACGSTTAAPKPASSTSQPAPTGTCDAACQQANQNEGRSDSNPANHTTQPETPNTYLAIQDQVVAETLDDGSWIDGACCAQTPETFDAGGTPIGAGVHAGPVNTEVWGCQVHLMPQDPLGCVPRGNRLGRELAARPGWSASRILTADHGPWSGGSAKGYGKFYTHTCVPNCAQGSSRLYDVHLSAWRVRSAYYTRLQSHFTGGVPSYPGPRTWMIKYYNWHGLVA